MREDEGLMWPCIVICSAIAASCTTRIRTLHSVHMIDLGCTAARCSTLPTQCSVTWYLPPLCTCTCAVAKKEKWVRDHQGQMLITAGQIAWTAECEHALAEADSAHKALRLLKKKWVGYLNKLTAVTTSKLNRIERNKAC